MTTRFARPLFTHHPFLAVAIALAIVLAGASALTTAQTAPPQTQTPAPAPVTAQAAPAEAPSAARKAMTIDDYTKWRSISGQEMSGDGKWVAYTLQLHQHRSRPRPSRSCTSSTSRPSADVTVADATDADFSPDSKWIAYQVDPGAAQRARARPGRGRRVRRLRRRHRPAPRRQPRLRQPGGAGAAQPASRRSVRPGRRGGAPFPRAAWSCATWRRRGRGALVAGHRDRSPSRRRPRTCSSAGAAADAAGAAGGRGRRGTPPAHPRRRPGRRPGRRRDESRGPRGADAILLDLRTGGHQLLGSVADIAFNRTGELLAYTVDAAVKDANGLFVFDTRNGRTTRARQRRRRCTTALAWNEDGNAARGAQGQRRREDARARQRAPRLPGHHAGAEGRRAPLPRRCVLDPAKADGLPQGLGGQRPRPARLERGQHARLLRHEGAGAVARHHAPDRPTRRPTSTSGTPSDERVQSLQMIRANQDRNFTFRRRSTCRRSGSSSSPTRP